MIRNTMNQTKDATFCVQLPNNQLQGMPAPTGTGFFVSSDGWFITAAHVTSVNGSATGTQRTDIDKCWLMKEHGPGDIGSMCQHVELVHAFPEYDVVFLKVDFDKNSNKEWLKGMSSFPYIPISSRGLEMGEPVYSFGYPLSQAEIVSSNAGGVVASQKLSPRLTSAVVSSDLNMTSMMMTAGDPKQYVLDKALNYGNSGGPIVAVETGRVHALCSSFQPVHIPQHHLADPQGNTPHIMIPSLYGVVSSLNNVQVLDFCSNNGIPVVGD